MANTNDCWFAKPNPEKIGPDESHTQRTSVSPSFQEKEYLPSLMTSAWTGTRVLADKMHLEEAVYL